MKIHISAHKKFRPAPELPGLATRVALGALMFAVSATASSAGAYPKPIQEAVDAGVKVVREFPAASGLTGWVMSQGGQHSIVFTTQDKKALLVGALVGENGENLSAQYEEQYVPKPDLSAPYQELEKSSYVAEGTTKNPKSVIYVFVDANCPFCHFAWKALQPYEKAGLQVRWILVDTLGPTSMPKAIEVLAAPDKTAAFRKMEENHGKPWTALPQFSAASKPDVAAKIRKNGELMGALGISGTPGIVWKDRQGRVNIKAGMPRLTEIPSITGIPEQKVDDPDLARFR